MPRGPLASIPSPARAIWHWGPVPLRAQELAIVAGIVVAIAVADLRYRRAGGPRGVITDGAAWAATAGLIIAAVGDAAARAHGVPWPAVHTADSILGFPGAVALGAVAAWYACRRVRLPDRIKFAPVLSAAAPAIAFGNAVAQLGSWFTQTGFGRPSTLPWGGAVFSPPPPPRACEVNHISPPPP